MYREVNNMYREVNKMYREVNNMYREVNNMYREVNNMYSEVNKMYREVNNMYREVNNMYREVLFFLKKNFFIFLNDPSRSFFSKQKFCKFSKILFVQKLTISLKAVFLIQSFLVLSVFCILHF